MMSEELWLMRKKNDRGCWCMYMCVWIRTELLGLPV